MDDEFYQKQEKSYERVTRVLDYFAPPELVSWKVKVGQKMAGIVGRQAIKTGKCVDEMIREGRIPKAKDSQEVKNCMIAWDAWKTDYAPSNIEFPSTLFCEKRLLAGTPDFIWKDGDELSDIKTSNSVRESYFFQLGAYASLLPKTPKRISVLRLDKKLANYEFVTNESVGLSIYDCINGFNGLLLYYRAYQRVQSTLNRKGIAQMEEVQ